MVSQNYFRINHFIFLNDRKFSGSRRYSILIYPLDRLGQLNTHDAGLGTFIKDNFIYSSLVGYVNEVTNSGIAFSLFFR